MTAYLVDTNVISESVKSRPHPGVVAWLATQDLLRLGAITVFELAAGAERMPGGRRRRFVEEWLAVLLAASVEVFAFDRSAALTAARIDGDARRKGRPVPDRDLLVLATAKANGLGVATRDLDHFRGHGVALYDPFDDVHAM